MLVLWLVISHLLRHREFHKKGGPLEQIVRLVHCAVIFSLVELLKTLGCRMLSLRALAENLFSKLRVRCLILCLTFTLL